MNNKPTIGLIGAFQNGKSTLVNCLFGRQLAKVGGLGVSVTCVNTRYTYHSKNEVDFVHNGKVFKTVLLDDYLTDSVDTPTNATEIIIRYQDSLLERFDIIDTPGFNANESDSTMAENAFTGIDIAILVLRNKSISQYEFNILRLLSQYSIPFFILVNTYDEGDDLWNPKSIKNSDIVKCIWNDLTNVGLKPLIFEKRHKIITVNLIWYWLSINSDTGNKAIRLSQKKLRFFWEEYFDQDVSARSLFFKSNFNELFCKLTSRKFLRCALTCKNKRLLSINLENVLRDFNQNCMVAQNRVHDYLQYQNEREFESERKQCANNIESINKRIAEIQNSYNNRTTNSGSMLASIWRYVTSDLSHEYKLRNAFSDLENEKQRLSDMADKRKIISQTLSSILK